MSNSRKLLFILTGSISAFKAAAAISTLKKRGFEIQTVASPSALEFVGPATLEGLTGRPVLTRVFESGHMMDHINLARWADAAVVCPATANVINKLAAGLADDLIGSLFLAWGGQKPWLVFPAMNHEMLAHPATQAAIQKLKSFNVQVMETGEGLQACGETGEGRLLEPDEIMRKIEKTFEKEGKRKILITAGGTREPIDSVRAITNTSTGKTGVILAERLAQEGFEVTLLLSKTASHSPQNIEKVIRFDSFSDLEKELFQQLETGSFTACIHAAAVSDFSVDRQGKPVPEKIESESDIELKLKRNPKLVELIKRHSKHPLTLVAFKLTSGADAEQIQNAVHELFASSNADVIVQNDMQGVLSQGSERVFNVFRNGGLDPQPKTGIQELARSLNHDLSP